ncbi:MAG TPA: folylpolyglutamate synthase/dihydrofolate synthase family protein [Verrucomicrobiae bacterium]
MTYAEAIQYLYGLQWFGTKLGLENTRALANLCGAPDEQLRFIHVAGTNGKGSVCAMLESIYRHAGLRVGLFTSPHLVAFGERIQINRQMISEADLVRLVTHMQAKLKELPTDQHPTLFEFVTVLALLYFAEQKCDLVIWETGLGGRLDATNIVTPLASVITNIAFDHTQWLGDTLAKIAGEKAGIIKPNLPVLTAADAPEAVNVIRETAAQKQAPLHIIGAAEISAFTYPLSLLGEHQKQNAALALAVVQELQEQLPVNKPAITQGLANVHWPGRLQLVTLANGQRILIDGAHNEDGMTLLRQTLQTTFASEKPVLIMGALEDKDWRQMCTLIAPMVAEIHLVPVSSQRTATPSELAEVCQRINPCVMIHVYETLSQALAATSQKPFRLITGSLYLVGEAMEKLGIAAIPSRDERALNEWGAKR